MLTVITGPMFAGKTTYLINLLIANIKVRRLALAFKPAGDRRYSETFIQSHNEAKFSSIPIQSPTEVFDWISKFCESRVDGCPEVIGFDEAQFFNSAEMEKTASDLLSKNYDLIIAGLAQNSFGEPFGAMGSLLAMADEVVQLPALCAKCKHNKATRTYRISLSKEKVLIGGSNDYEPRCYSCWRI